MTSKKAKTIALVAIVLAFIIIALQNTEAVETRLLFVTMTMPRVVLLVVTLAVGFAAGMWTGYRLKARKSAE